MDDSEQFGSKEETQEQVVKRIAYMERVDPIKARTARKDACDTLQCTQEDLTKVNRAGISGGCLV